MFLFFIFYFYFTQIILYIKIKTGIERVMSTERMEWMLSSITDQIPCGVMLIEKNSGYVEFCNPASFEYLKVSRGQLFESHLNENLRNVIFSSEVCDTLLWEFKNCSLKPMTERSAEVTVQTLTGRVLTFLCKPNNKTLTEIKGTPVECVLSDRAIVWIVNDVTAMNTAMEQKHDAILRFMKCTSHDMRTPMQVCDIVFFLYIS
jgi:PAS domain-containing protein